MSSLQESIQQIISKASISDVLLELGKLTTVEKTSESQGHGKAIEMDIQKTLGMDDNEIKNMSHTAIHDIPSEKNKSEEPILKGKNISIKTTCSDFVCCGDAFRFIESMIEGKIIMIIAIWEQDGDYKKIRKTCIVDLDKLLEVLRKIGENIEDYKKSVIEYSSLLKKLPNGKIENTEIYKSKKKEIVEKYPEISKILKLNPKVDSKTQRRLQMSFDLRIMKNIDTIIWMGDGAIIIDKEYNSVIKSPSRSRSTLTMQKIKIYCAENNIRGPGKRGGWTNMKKADIEKYLLDKNVCLENIICPCK